MNEDVYGVATSETPNLTFATKEMEKEYVIEEDYMTGELDTRANEDSYEDMLLVLGLVKKKQ